MVQKERTRKIIHEKAVALVAELDTELTQDQQIREVEVALLNAYALGRLHESSDRLDLSGKALMKSLEVVA